VAVAEQVTAGPAAHQVAWLSAAEVGEDPGVVEDTRLLATEVFARIDDLVGAEQRRAVADAMLGPPASAS